MPPDYGDVIRRLVGELPADGRISVTGLRDPEGWPKVAGPVVVGAQPALRGLRGLPGHRQWEAVQAATSDTRCEDTLLGGVYLAAGHRPRPFPVTVIRREWIVVGEG